jgi:hypothetical protein
MSASFGCFLFGRFCTLSFETLACNFLQGGDASPGRLAPRHPQRDPTSDADDARCWRDLARDRLPDQRVDRSEGRHVRPRMRQWRFARRTRRREFGCQGPFRSRPSHGRPGPRFDSVRRSGGPSGSAPKFGARMAIRNSHGKNPCRFHRDASRVPALRAQHPQVERTTLLLFGDRARWGKRRLQRRLVKAANPLPRPTSHSLQMITLGHA